MVNPKWRMALLRCCRGQYSGKRRPWRRFGQLLQVADRRQKCAPRRTMAGVPAPASPANYCTAAGEVIGHERTHALQQVGDFRCRGASPSPALAREAGENYRFADGWGVPGQQIKRVATTRISVNLVGRRQPSKSWHSLPNDSNPYFLPPE
jgi:hypothetical protein